MKRFNTQQINNSQTMTLIMVQNIVIITSDMIDGVVFGHFVMRHGRMTD
jgi:hypothetical protein